MICSPCQSTVVCHMIVELPNASKEGSPSQYQLWVIFGVSQVAQLILGGRLFSVVICHGLGSTRMSHSIS